MIMHRGLGCLGVLAGLVLLPVTVNAATFEVSPDDDVEAAIAALQPGDELILHGGTYTLTDRFTIDIAGTEGTPIVIRAADGETPHLERPNADQNIVDIDSADWVEIRGIEFSGGSAGVRLSMVSNFTFVDNHIHDTGDVALRANDTGVTYSNLVIARNHIHHTNNTGEGMYLGCNDDGCRVANSIIEGNYVHHTNQQSVDQGDGIELKEGSFGVTIRDNVIHDTKYPCILTYSAAGNGAANTIEGNVMWNCGDHAIQSAADAVIRNNIILSAAAHGISMQAHQSGAPTNLRVLHNTIVIPSGNAINVSGAVGDVTIANNAVFSMAGSAISLGGDTSQIVVRRNVGEGGLSGGDSGFVVGALTDFLAGHYDGVPPIDLRPSANGALAAAGDPAHAVASDFNHVPTNDPPDVGAYAYNADGNAGWSIGENFKPLSGDAPIATAGGGSSGAAGAAGTTGAGGADNPGASGGATAAGDTAKDSGGCGCRLARPYERGVTQWWFALALALGYAVARQRRRARPKTSSSPGHRASRLSVTRQPQPLPSPAASLAEVAVPPTVAGSVSAPELPPAVGGSPPPAPPPPRGGLVPTPGSSDIR